MGLISFLLFGCSGNGRVTFGRVTFEDYDGNKRTFKKENLICKTNFRRDIYCEGSLIKKDVAGNRYVINIESTYCRNEMKDSIYPKLICFAANKFGKLGDFPQK